GIQIGGIGALVPERRADLVRLGPRAMLGGAMACWTTGCIAGVLVQ
ncbi:MAG: NupC/NupG family nucleoside CNT transporter, partial [Planctomycetes bacterium]|nr:NupC/NupG family nucleoside CNT transporter [Planctomycetota bacterium]